ncbi:hypothetical protein GCM10028804_29050 [Larkinella terrae]
MGLLVGIWLVVPVWAAPAKRALLIGIANYRAAGLGWPNTPADRDLVLMKTILQEHGFLNQNISVLPNQQATFAGIHRRMEVFIASLTPGDKVVILFSGHGQQVPDDNGDEIDDEGDVKYDEAFVAYDTPSETGQGEKHIRDDQIGLWIDRIRRRIGPNGHLLLLMDSCHSGTINRGEGSVRGGKPPIRPVLVKKTGGTAASGEIGSGYLDKKRVPSSGPGLGKFILMTACLPNQLNYDLTDDQGKPIGALTYAVSCAFRQLERNDTYARMFSKAAAFIDPNTQNPTLEGDGGERVLGGSFTAYQPVLSLTAIKNAGEQLIEVAGGYVAGVYNRAKIAFYPKSGQARGKAPLATGHVVNGSLTRSWVRIDSGRVAGLPAEIRAVETEKAFGNWRVKVQIAKNVPAELQRTLSQALGNQPAILVGQSGDLRIETSQNYLLLRHTDTYQPYDSVLLKAPDAVAYCVNRIIDYGQAKVIRNLSFTNPHYAIRADFVPVRVQADSTTGSVTADTVTLLKTAFPQFPSDVQGQLTIYNEGDRDVYITLINIPPGGRLSILLPDETADDQIDGLLIPAGQKSPPFYFAFNPPYGTEFYKIIATPRPLELRPTVESRGADRSAGAQNPFAFFVGNTYRGESPTPIPSDEMATTTVTFKVVPEKTL